MLSCAKATVNIEMISCVGGVQLYCLGSVKSGIVRIVCRDRIKNDVRLHFSI